MKLPLGSLKRASKDWLKRELRRAVQRVSQSNSRIPPAYFDIHPDASGAPCWAGQPLEELSRTWGSPLHVVNAARLRDNVRRFSSVSRECPPCEVFYSYKTNPVPGVLRELHRHGVGAEVISHYELWLALELGVNPDKIIYNGPAKSPESLELAIEHDIALINLNHRQELDVVARLASAMGRRVRVGLRVSMGGWSGQFGTPVHGGQASAAFAEALANPHLQVIGLHVHRGGMMRTEAEAAAFVSEVLAFSDDLQREHGFSPQIVDLGGSLGSPSVRGLAERELRLNRTFLRELTPPDPASALGIEAYARLVSERVAAHFRAAGRPLPRVFLEPGRSLSSDAQLLLTRVLALKPQGETTYAILDAGINLAESCRGEYHEILPLRSSSSATTQTYTLVGPICTPGDTLRWAVRLPELEVGDTLAIMDAGAYFVPFSTSFSFPRPGIVMLRDGTVSALRSPETFEDMLRLDARAVSSG